MSLHAVSKMVMLGDLERATNKVRSGKWSKTDKLPYITPSGCFTKRKESEIVSYSGIVCSIWMMNVQTLLLIQMRTAKPLSISHCTSKP